LNASLPVCYRLQSAYSSAVGKTKRHQQAIYLDHDKAKLLDTLAQRTRIAKQVLMREAIDDLLTKYKMLKPKRKP
jgi:hypothetical protein